MTWNSWLTTIILVTFLTECTIAYFIYRKSRNQRPSQSTHQHQILVFHQSSHQQTGSKSTNTNPHGISPNIRTQKFLVPLSSQDESFNAWSRFSHGICIGSLFLTTFLVINYLFHPLTHFWTLSLLAILLPLPFLALPFLFQFKSQLTFILLLTGLGLGLFVILLL